jgi:hypothetical protein
MQFQRGDTVYAKEEIIMPADSDAGHPAFVLARKDEELIVVEIKQMPEISEWPYRVLNTLNETFWTNKSEVEKRGENR